MSITDKFNYLKQTKENLKEVINLVKDEDEDKLTEESTFRSYPEALRKNYIKALNEGSDFIYGSLDKVTEEGETVVLDNTAVAPMKVSLNGNISQEKINAEAGTEIVNTEISISDTNNEKENYITLQGNTYQETIEAQAGSEVEDTELAVNDVDSSKENYIILNGNTSQETTSGKNLIDDYDLINRYNVASVSGNIITSNAINSNYNVIQPRTKTQTINLIENTDYYVSFDCRLKSGSYSAKLGTGIIDGVNGTSWSSGSTAISNPNMTGSYQRYSFKCIATITTNSIIGLTIQVQQNLSDAVFEIKNIMISTSSDDTYEKYTGGQPSPSPDYPQEVKVVKGENVVSVSGKNLLNMNYLVEANADKTYAAHGFWAFKLTDVVGTYTLSRENADVVSGSSYIAWGEGNDLTTAYNSKTWLAHPSLAGFNSQSQVKNNSGELWLFLHANETRIQNIPNDFGYLMLEKGSTATPYVPYSKTDYEVNLGKNLFNYQNQNYSAVRASYILENNGLKITSSGSYAMITTDFDVEIGKTYTISFDTINSDNIAAGIQIRSSTALITSGGGDTGNHSLTFTPTENKVYFRFYSNTSGTETTNEVQYQNIQIEEGSVATSYSPYFTPIELCKIGDYQDYLFKRNNKWYTHKEIGKVVLNGNEDWADREQGSATYLYLKCTLQNGADGGISNKFKYNQSYNAPEEHILVDHYWKEASIVIRKDRLSTPNVANFKSWLSNNKVTLYYVLATSTEEEITNSILIEQLNNLYTAQLNNGANYIDTETENLFPYINLKYNIVTQMPNPEKPSEIETVKGNNVVNVQGKNLLGLINGTYSHNGITAVVSNGTITITGTATANSFVNIPLLKNIVLSNEQVTISVNNATTISDSATEFRVYETGNNYMPVNFTSTNKTTTITKTGTYTSAYVRTSNGVNYGSGLVIKPQLELGSTATPYVPYSKTDYPINLDGKNLFNMNNATYVKKYGSSYSVDGQEITVTPTTTWGNVTYSYKVENNTTYTLKMKITFEGTTQSRWWLSLGNEENDAVYNGGYIDLEDGYLIKTFTTTSKILTISFQGSTTIQPTSTLFSEIQLELGSTATDYEPYITPIELCKISNYKDYLYKNNGKWYVHKVIGKKVVTSSETLAQTDSYSNVIYYKFNKNTDSINYNNYNSMVAFYTHAKISNSFNFDSLSQVSTINSLAENTRYWVGFPKGTTLAQAKEKLVGSILYYVLAEPVETEITSLTLIEQLDNLYTAQLNNGINYITTETGNLLPYIDLKYNVVTQMPSPERPSEIKKVIGENIISVQSKNHIDLTKHTNTLASNTTILNPNSFQCDLNGSWKGEIIVPIENLKPNTMYTFSANVNSSADFSLISYLRGYNGNEFTNIIKDIYFNWFKNGYRFNSGEYERYELKMFIVGNQSRTGVEKLEDLQIEEGTAKTDFAPYSKTDYPINLGDIELCKINTYKDYFHKDSGKWYVHKEIGKVVLDGSESWNSYNNAIGNFTVRVRNTLMKSGYLTVLLCDYFRNTLNGDRANKGEVGNTNQYYNLNFVPTDDLSITNVVDWKNWLSTHNVAVYYPLAIPTETEITNTTLIEQLEAISKAKSIKDKTYITQTNEEISFIIDVTAIKKYEEVQ